jgi:hypothetical protein
MNPWNDPDWYYNQGPDVHHNNDDICDLEDKIAGLKKELDILESIEDGTTEQEIRCYEICQEIEDLESSIQYLEEN